MPRGRRSTRSSVKRSASSSSRRKPKREESDDDDDIPTPDSPVGAPSARSASISADTSNYNGDTHRKNDVDNEEGVVGMQFSQLEPEVSEALPMVRPSDREKFDDLNPATKEKLVKTMTRLILFKGLAGEHIDRKKCAEELAQEMGDFFSGNAANRRSVSAIAFEKASERIHNVFGFQVKGVPSNMIDLLPAKFKDRYYLVNPIADSDGTHSRKLHASSLGGAASAKEKALLMVVLSMAYCRGSSQQSHNTGGGGRTSNSAAMVSSGMRWISDSELYRLLSSVDPAVSNEPPPVGKAAIVGSGKRDPETREIDVAIDRFVYMDYLIREQVQEGGEAPSMHYTMGPRSALEVGRKQLVFFIAEVLDQEPDPTMLAEIDHTNNDDEDEQN